VKKRTLIWLSMLLVVWLGALSGGCWTTRAVTAPSENVSYILNHKVGSARSRVLRCEFGKSCSTIYDTKRCSGKSGRACSRPPQKGATP